LHPRERGRHRRFDRMVGDQWAVFVHVCSGRAGAAATAAVGLRRADVARRKDPALDHGARPPVERQVDSTERAAERVRLDDRDPFDLVRDGLMRVPGRDRVHEPARQSARDSEDLRVRIARREIVR
jgi:hypothetical protein